MTTIAIGLDSAGPELLQELIDAGDLPTFRYLRKKGAFGRLQNFDVFTAELPWTTFSTGVMPEETGYWTPLKYSPNYTIKTRAAYEYDEYPAFFALGNDYRVCAFDVPQVRLQKDLHGMQFNAWGAHSPQVPQESNEPELFRELINLYGEHPGLHCDYAHALDMRATRQVYDKLMEGIKRRGKICADLLQRENWDLFLTVFGESHGAGHNFWQFEPGHPLFDKNIPGRAMMPDRPMRDIFMAIDAALTKILESAPKDANIIIFSAHGMGDNTLDLPSMFYLPELMYRWNFHRPALGSPTTMKETFTSQHWGAWTRHVWNDVKEGSPLAKAARRWLPSRIYNMVAPLVEYRDPYFPMSPALAEKVLAGLPSWQTAGWYMNCWPKMKAFALMSFSEGYIRINVKGREKNGIVDPHDYRSVVDEICAELGELTCARTGLPMVSKTLVTRDDPLDSNPKLPDADIVVSWQEQFATDAVTHPKFGRIGPVPHFRAGSHRHTGFILMTGDGIPENSYIKNGHALDIAPTILDRLGIQAPSYIKGRSMQAVCAETEEPERDSSIDMSLN